MNFEIFSHSRMEELPPSISLPNKIRRELGVITGQQLQFLVGAEEIFLRIMEEVERDQEVAYVSAEVLKSLQLKPLTCRIPEITLGCDPEFFIVWKGRRISAATYLPFQGQIGCDGELGELRPMYGRHEDQVVKNLSGLIPKIPTKLKRAAWAAHSPEAEKEMTFEAYSYFLGTAAGFHVHLGIPPEILNGPEPISRPVMNYIIKCLDWYASVPLVLLETENQRRVGRSAYGKPGDYRTTNVTLEYRTPGAFYLRSPAMARGLLGLSLLVTEFVVGQIKEISHNFGSLKTTTPAQLESVLPIPRPMLVKSILTEPSKGMAERAYPRIKEVLVGLPNYAAHRTGIEELFRAVEEKKIPVPNLLTNWEKSA